MKIRKIREKGSNRITTGIERVIRNKYNTFSLLFGNQLFLNKLRLFCNKQKRLLSCGIDLKERIEM